MPPERVRVKSAAIGPGFVAPNPIDDSSVGMEFRALIEVIIALDPAKCLDAITPVRHHNVVTNLHVRSERVGDDDVAVMACRVCVLARPPLVVNLVEIIEPFVGPINVPSPAHVDQPVLQTEAYPVLFHLAAPKRRFEHARGPVET